MPIRKEELIEIKRLLGIEPTSKTIKLNRKLAIEQELNAINICLNEDDE